MTPEEKHVEIANLLADSDLSRLEIVDAFLISQVMLGQVASAINDDGGVSRDDLGRLILATTDTLTRAAASLQKVNATVMQKIMLENPHVITDLFGSPAGDTHLSRDAGWLAGDATEGPGGE